ncbi:MAG TPA: diguanylate cyclase [Steroidobacteraceae bacterium]|nr:diguanylate cyclase [Steroidobacteraceae bacterium]
MNPARLRFQPSIFVIVALALAAVLLAVIAVPQWFSRQARMDVLRANVGQIARLAASVVDGDLHRELIDPVNFNEATYTRALQPLVKLHSASPDIFYLYTMVEREGKTFFVLDTANSPVLTTPRALKASAYLELFELRKEYESDWLQQIAAGKTWVTPTFQQDDFGNFLTGHAPIYDSQGKHAGFVGVDFNLQYYMSQEARFRSIFIASLIAALVIAVVLAYLLARYQYALYAQMQRHYQSSLRDELTALFNRRGALAAVASALARRKATTHATLLVDIDNFKNINDTYGHVAGDAVIGRLAESINRCIRVGDICARLGGDEFMIFAPDCDLNGAREIAERLLAGVRADKTDEVSYSVSIGISVEKHLNADFDAMYRRADTALYQAKSDGKNNFAVCLNAVSTYTP